LISLDADRIITPRRILTSFAKALRVRAATAVRLMAERSTQARSVCDVLDDRARAQSDDLAYVFLDGDDERARVTYGELRRAARRMAARLQAFVDPGERALLLYPSGIDYLIGFFGCLYAGVIAVPLFEPSHRRVSARIRAVAEDAKPAVALSHARFAGGDGSARAAALTELEGMRWIVTDEPADNDIGEECRRCASDEDTLAFLQYTSGSTSRPKGVMVTHGNLLDNLHNNERGLALSTARPRVSWLPLFHDLGLIFGALQPLYRGVPGVLMAPVAFVDRPLRWLRAMSEYGASVTAAPNFAYELCVDKIPPAEREGLDLSQWEVAVNGAEPIAPATVRRFMDAFGPCGFHPRAMRPSYGLAECTVGVTFSRGSETGPHTFTLNRAELARGRAVAATPREADARDACELVSCGSPLGQRITIVDPRTNATCPAGIVGEIWLQGGSVARGYWNRPQDSRETFAARTSDTDEGPFLRTGDLGFMLDGVLTVTGRMKEIIIIEGNNYYPQDIEASVRAASAEHVKPQACAFSIDGAANERLVIVREIRNAGQAGQLESIAAEVRRAVAEQHQLDVYAVALVRRGVIPKTSSGKLQRRGCRDAYLNGSLEILACSIQEPTAPIVPAPSLGALLAADDRLRRELVEAYLAARLARLLEIPASHVDVSRPMQDLGLDSLRGSQLKEQIEMELGVTLALVDVLQTSLPTLVLDALAAAAATREHWEEVSL
jgi:acyl-CoA synthetase (AMP-forming)/AMP-acid ligase II